MTQVVHLAEFEDLTCLGLVAQECYYQGDLVEPANVVFLHVGPARWFRFYIDCGDFGRTEVAAVNPIEPEVSQADFRYPLVDLAAHYPVVGRRVIRAELRQVPPDGADFSLVLDDGATIALVNRDDLSVVEYRPRAG